MTLVGRPDRRAPNHPRKLANVRCRGNPEELSISQFEPISELRETKLASSVAPRGTHSTVPRNSIFLLKIYLRSKPGNDSMPSNAVHIGIVLDDRLDQERSVIQQYIELDAVLGLPGNRAWREEIGAQTVSHIAQRYGVVKTQRQRLVEAQPCRELHEVAVDIRRTPVDRKHRIQAPCFFRVSAPECLARLPIQ